MGYNNFIFPWIRPAASDFSASLPWIFRIASRSPLRGDEGRTAPVFSSAVIVYAYLHLPHMFPTLPDSVVQERASKQVPLARAHAQEHTRRRGQCRASVTSTGLLQHHHVPVREAKDGMPRWRARDWLPSRLFED